MAAKPKVTFEQIMSDLKNKSYSPIYFLMGEESYFIDEISDYIEDHVLTKEEKDFNQIVMFGRDVDAATVINTAKRFPMMSPYQVVIVKEAQNIKDIETLAYYVEKPLKSTVLVVDYKYKTLDKRKKLYKLVESNGVLFESSKIYEDKIPEWIGKYLKSQHYTVDPAGGRMLVDFLGDDLSKIVNAINKLILTLPANSHNITPEHIEKNIGISKDYNNFELQKAIAQKNVLKANRIIDHFSKNPSSNPIVLTFSILYAFFNKILLYHYLNDKSQYKVASALKISPFFVKDYELAAKKYSARKAVENISLLREYDLKSKGKGSVSVSQGELLKELVFKVMH